MTYTQNVRGYLTNPKLMFFSIWLRLRAIFLSYFCFLVCVFAVSSPWILFCDVGRRLLPSASDIREKALTRFSRLATNIVLTRTLSLIFVDLFVLFLIINTIIGQFFACSFGYFFLWFVSRWNRQNATRLFPPHVFRNWWANLRKIEIKYDKEVVGCFFTSKNGSGGNIEILFGLWMDSVARKTLLCLCALAAYLFRG